MTDAIGKIEHLEARIRRLESFIQEWARHTQEAGFTNEPGPYKAWSAKTTECFAYNASIIAPW